LFRDTESKESLPATQFNMKWVETAGLVKFDFLGLKTLTVIEKAVDLIGRDKISIAKLPLDDKKTFELLARGDGSGVFQLEGNGMRDVLRKMKPDRFEDIIAVVALYRPGPMENIPSYIKRKHKEEMPDYLHPLLEGILKETHGIMIYQEQVMQIAQVLAGYTLGGADLLRRAMGKKKPEEMAKQRSIFLKGSVERGVPEEQAAYIFDLMEKFAGYGFNKSHSAAYALLSYQTAYLKAHYPAAFMAAVLSADMDHTDKVVTLIQECAEIDLAVEPPHVNASLYEFAVGGGRSIRYGLGAVRGVGQGAVEAMISEREARGPYTSLEDLCRRLDLQKVNRRVLEALLRSGSLDSLGANRATLMHTLPTAMQLGDQNSKARDAGQNDMFGLTADE